MSMADLANVHRRLNRETRDAWDGYRDQRARVMALIGEPTRDDERLLVLGAGNCNDVDLDALAERFVEVHLVDIDASALKAAVSRAGERAREVTRTHRLDVSGLLERIGKWKRRPPSPETLRDVPERAAASLGKLPIPFDRVVSSLVLSQLVHSAMVGLGVGHPALEAVSKISVIAHLTMATRALRPGGRLVLVVDTVARPPEVMAEWIAAHGPDALLHRLEASGQCLPGTEVALVTQVLHDLSPSASIELEPAWTWSPGARTHLVYALRVHSAG